MPDIHLDLRGCTILRLREFLNSPVALPTLLHGNYENCVHNESYSLIINPLRRY